MSEGIEANAPMMKTTGTLDDPIIVNSAGDEQLAGCTGYPADSHVTLWLGVRPPPLSPLLTTCSPTPFCLRQNRTPHHKLLADPNPPSPQQMSRARPVSRCGECGSVYRMEYIGPPDDPHAHHGHGEEHGDAAHNYEEPKTFADYVRPEYRGTPQPHYKKS